uniref:Uncharacterized protein n=1 Tax=Rhipicephalus zambeziensis TaxID=60191 RepID=A0A224YIB8_9ACAR
MSYKSTQKSRTHLKFVAAITKYFKVLNMPVMSASFACLRGQCTRKKMHKTQYNNMFSQNYIIYRYLSIKITLCRQKSAVIKNNSHNTNIFINCPLSSSQKN